MKNVLLAMILMLSVGTAYAGEPSAPNQIVILQSPTGCSAGWQDRMAKEVAEYTAAGIPSDHILCFQKLDEEKPN